MGEQEPTRNHLSLALPVRINRHPPPDAPHHRPRTQRSKNLITNHCAQESAQLRASGVYNEGVAQAEGRGKLTKVRPHKGEARERRERRV